jgi:sugar fermentation stimulation protein
MRRAVSPRLELTLSHQRRPTARLKYEKEIVGHIESRNGNPFNPALWDYPVIVYRFQGELREASVIKRVNRFLVEVNLSGIQKPCHLHDPGRLRELIFQGNRVLVRSTKGRVTDCSVTAAWGNGRWVILDSRIHNQIASKFLPPNARREVTVEGSRLDFSYGNTFVEVKGCSLVVDGVALFPDAPTQRGRRHVELLGRLRERGMGARILVLVMRDDASCFSPNWGTDPGFSSAFRKAVKVGVEVEVMEFRLVGREVEYAGGNRPLSGVG